MAIFNSLGSNYNLPFVIKSLFTPNSNYFSERLKKYLEEKYGGEAILLYKGREALRLALKIIDKNDATVAVCGYTCYAVYEPVISEGYDIEYLDIEKETLHFSYKALQEKLHSNPKIKILIIQNTLGYPCDMDRIKKICHEKNIVLIEDLAHSVGAAYRDGKEVGTVGDFTLFSFSQDKMIDGVSGGALVVRDKNFQLPISKFQIKKIHIRKQILDRFYPLLTLFIRKTYESGVGKIVHYILKKMNLLIQPMDSLDSSVLHALPSWNAELIYQGFCNLEKNVNHRKVIAGIYSDNIDQKLFPGIVKKEINNSSHVRFPLLIADRKKLIAYLQKNNFFISDIWFDAPVAPKKYLSLTNYDKQCPVAENVADTMLNLPTHKNINNEQAKYLSELITLWHKS